MAPEGGTTKLPRLGKKKKENCTMQTRPRRAFDKRAWQAPASTPHKNEWLMMMMNYSCEPPPC